jgi:hypothetical protein
MKDVIFIETIVSDGITLALELLIDDRLLQLMMSEGSDYSFIDSVPTQG